MLQDIPSNKFTGAWNSSEGCEIQDKSASRVGLVVVLILGCRRPPSHCFLTGSFLGMCLWGGRERVSEVGREREGKKERKREGKRAISSFYLSYIYFQFFTITNCYSEHSYTCVHVSSHFCTLFLWNNFLKMRLLN